jgi:TetR/AcrR family transcriptional regulator, fatty acid metabolism regulator protein
MEAIKKPETVSEKARSTRKRILDAAIKVFANKGYHETKVDDIVEVSGNSKGAVYFYFPGKQQIFLALIDEFADLLYERLEKALLQEADGVQRLNRALQACLETFGHYRGLAKIFLIQAVGLGAAFEEKRLEIHERFAGLIKTHLDEAVREGEIPPLDTDVVAYAWMGAINEIVIHWVHTGQPEPERVIATLHPLLLRSIGVTEARIQALEMKSSTKKGN